MSDYEVLMVIFVMLNSLTLMGIFMCLARIAGRKQP